VREPPKLKNERVEFLNDLIEEQKGMMSRLKPQRAASISKKPPLETFCQQAARNETSMKFWVTESFDGSQWPSDPLRSLRSMWWRVPTVKVKPPSKRDRVFDGPSFWEVHRGA
jgi:hypothetical protein